MIARRLLDELQGLDRDEKLQVIQFLTDDLSDYMKEPLEGKLAVKMSPRFIASDGGAALKRVLEKDQAQHDG